MTSWDTQEARNKSNARPPKLKAKEPLKRSMMAALGLLRDEMQGEVCSECLDLRKGFNAAGHPQKPSPKGFG